MVAYDGEMGDLNSDVNRDGGRDEGGSRWVVVGVLFLLCLMVRLQGMGKTAALPIFGDEAIYLRWAQLIREGHWWVSLFDPKPPLHFWLIAAVFDWSRDPLVAARMISVVCGALSVPALMVVCDEVGLLAWASEKSSPPTGRMLGILSAVLMIFCPFVSFYQRLATADALFILEMLVCVWLGMRWGRQVVKGERAWGTAIGLGIAMGAGMMTRQGLSYVLWAIPPATVLLHGGSRNRKVIAAGAAQLLLAVVIAGAIWVPYLVAEFPEHAVERGGTASEIRARVLYQDKFTAGDVSRAGILLRNAKSVFVPTWKGDLPETGWLYLYMTWPMYMASIAGLAWIGARRQWRVLALLGLWLVLMLGVPMVLGTVLRSRYIVAGVLPLLIAAAYFAVEMLGLALSSRRAWLGWGIAIVLFAGLLVLPLLEIVKQGTTWWKQTLTREDRYQHVTGWTAGLATMKAIDFVRNFAPRGPVVVITNDGWGTPADAEWVYLSVLPNVSIYYTNHTGDYPLLMPAPSGERDTFMLKKNKWLYTPEEAVHIPLSALDAPVVLYLTNDPVYTADGPVDAKTFLQRKNPNLAEVETFSNVGADSDRVVVFELKNETRKTNG